MNKVAGASKVAHVKSRVSSLLVLVFAFVSIGLSPAFAVDERVIDIVEVTWPGADAPVGNASAMAKVIDTEVNTDWKIFTTLYGDTKDRVVSFVSGRVLKEPIELLSKMPCSGPAASQFLDSIRPEAYGRLGISNNSDRYLLVVAPKAGCIWSGRAQLGDKKSKDGILILHETASSFVISHELGHTFGLGHTNFLRCDNAAYDGAWSDTCKGIEYGGAIDVMGNIDTRSPLSTYHQWRMGLLDDSQVKQVWQSEVLTLAPSDFANGLRAIYIRDGKAAYWVEYRRKLEGVGYSPGLAIYRLDPPPVGSIVSPNPVDEESPSGVALGTDLWMLNLDTYQYRDSKSVGGSMTALTAKTYSGNVSFSAVASETSAVVTITKKADVTPPPVPPLVPVDQWRSPNMTIIKQGYEDADTAIAGFEAQIDGVVQTIKAPDIDGWIPTYLNPFVAPKSLYLRDLPEGSYTLAIRAIDIVGNKSDWSPATKVIVDRADPIVTNSFVANAVTPNQISVQWKGATDAGSGVCEASIVDEDGLILQSSTVKNAPTLKLETGSTLSGTARVFDCIGNGLSGELSVAHTMATVAKSSKTGKWSAANTFGAGAMKCTGKCTASFTVTGVQDVVVGTGAATVAMAGKNVATIADNKAAKPRIGASINVGSGRKVIRVTGSNFVLVGLSSVTTTLGSLRQYDRAPAIVDASLTDEKQVKLSKFGFRAEDFSQEWIVLPMARGTTLEDPTLDLCNAKFESESGRAERRQLSVGKSGSPFAFLSSEVVRYESVDAANAALKELKKVLEDCKTLGGYKEATGALTPYAFRSLPTIPTTLVAESNRVLVHATIGTGAESRQMLAFYQFNGAMFTGLYILTGSETPFTDAQAAKWVKVAATMAQRLQGKSA
jgi:hypothetical protein